MVQGERKMAEGHGSARREVSPRPRKRLEEAAPAAWTPLPARRVHCPKCEYEWDTKSKLKFVTCPSCYSKVNSVKYTVPELTEESNRVTT